MDKDYDRIMRMAACFADMIEKRAMRNKLTPKKMHASFYDVKSHQVPLITEYENTLYECVEILKGEMPLVEAAEKIGWISAYCYNKGWFNLEEIKLM